MSLSRIFGILSSRGSESVSFFLLIFAMGVGTTLVESLVFLYFVQDLKASQMYVYAVIMSIYGN